MISIGGAMNPNWSYPGNPSHVAAFASNLVSYVKVNRFDGIDLDIEQDAGTGNPPSRRAIFGHAPRQCSHAKASRTARGGTPLITSDVDPTTNFDLAQLQNPYVDQFNAMSYGTSRSGLASQIRALRRTHTSRAGGSRPASIRRCAVRSLGRCG